ncbi:type II/IV secretion system protein [Candidatus Peregrinibacteria bacterium]|jgi:type IV pilus assembly protein PilB|nr:type II/IV secretion system protein [Candidatus Peregrinibacteria bacterium]MBT4148601.1 type II/IV secretion system protein [Candidatus Peregrinibacteria bacterium]MBT4366273.1 type II/IV secretion system protein [Candidatus Peregrinibacteria bacterium]
MADEGTQNQTQDEKAAKPAAAPAAQAPAVVPAPAPAVAKPAAPAVAKPAAPAPTAAKVAPKAALANPKLKQLQETIISANIPQLVMMSISLALDMRSSDIHMEPEENKVRLRFRIDGVLQHIVEYPTNLHPAVVSRIKIMSNLKIDEQRVPQDGRTEVTTKEGREMDLRVSTMPTVNGEKIVMRIQDKSRDIPDLPELGIGGRALKNIEEALKSPNGIILNTGPTGSGKTTTLYSALSRLNADGVNILTIEDPVEIQIDGLNQSQVHPSIKYTFASGMRSALRQDPDIIMVGEIRDKETGNTAIEAALTGHLVLSTLHTNSAVETVTRILNMGIAPYLLSSTLELVIAQRLVRKICEHCKVEDTVDADTIDGIKLILSKANLEGEIDPALVEGMKFQKGAGCAECNKTGYHGRVGLYEVLRVDNKIRKGIFTQMSTLDIQDIALKNGMLTLEQDGILKALQGKTSLEEVYRVSKKGEFEEAKASKKTKEAPVADGAPAPESAPAEVVPADVETETTENQNKDQNNLDTNAETS